MNLKDGAADVIILMTLKRLAKKRLPSPIFHYIDGGADDEKTKN